MTFDVQTFGWGFGLVTIGWLAGAVINIAFSVIRNLRA